MSFETNTLLEADYLVVGAGAMGMAFTDTLLAESQASVIIVDRHDQPGGHWNDAYPFVRLHSASAYYGVGSTPLGTDAIEETGPDVGFHERASAAEICSYFDRVMRTKFLPSGRVRYLPKCDYRGDGRIVSLLSGAAYDVVAKRKVVDATYTDTAVPSKHPPKYSVAPGIKCIAPNALPALERAAERYVVIGAGKTGMDVCQWLLNRGVRADRIVWIMPRDSWLLDRVHVEPRAKFFKERMGAIALQIELIQKAETVEHLFELLAQRGQLLRLDERIVPPRYRCATLSQREIEELRRIENIVRLGHVQSIDADRIVMEKGWIPTNEATIHIDCTASGIRKRAPTAVFNGRSITLQPIRTCQQCFSAALIAHIELSYGTDDEKNGLSAPIPLPSRDVDWLRMFVTNVSNQAKWSTTPETRSWIAQSRLDLNYGQTSPLTTEENEILQRFKSGVGPAAEKLRALLKDWERRSECDGDEPVLSKIAQ